MAVMGVQLVVSLLTASLMHRMAPHFSFARWLLCNGSLFRYKHPTDEELRTLAGKPKPKGKKERRANGLSEEKPLSVPRDINLQLETNPITAIDALGVNSRSCAQVLTAVRAFPPASQGECTDTSLRARWSGKEDPSLEVVPHLSTSAPQLQACSPCPLAPLSIRLPEHILSCGGSSKVFLTVMRLYFSSEEGGERSVCLAFAFIFLLLAMLVLVVREDILEFGLEPGLASITQNLEPLLKNRGCDWWIPLIKLTFRLVLVAVCSVLGACLTFPGLRLAQTHLDALHLAADQPLLQLVLHTSFLAPVLILCLWIKPIARDFLLQAPMGKTAPVQLLSDSAFDSVRLWLVLALCLVRLAVTRPHLQAYLCLAQRWVEQMRKEAGRISALEIQRRVSPRSLVSSSGSPLLSSSHSPDHTDLLLRRGGELAVPGPHHPHPSPYAVTEDSRWLFLGPGVYQPSPQASPTAGPGCHPWRR
ncbi:transmembrane protein 161A isoform X3 [Vombatus ursinus]|uniref:transmembrane protein 161A isoform X3 n=1 Tax=Vombatus ursinus TaxID=29139 RepID=UPI000FFD59A5|nr:transmembrane protein 161A isoform X3 [Vombatus ursinus]